MVRPVAKSTSASAAPAPADDQLPGYGGEPYRPTPAPYPPPSGHDGGSTAMAGAAEPVPYPPPPPPNAVNFPPQYPNMVQPFPPAAGPQVYPQQMRPGLASPYIVGNPWSTGLFDCDRDTNNAVVTAFFPCVTFGQIAEILDQGQTSCTLGSIMYALLLPILSCSIMGIPYRQRLRRQYNLVQAPAEDWSLHIFCPCCALCQEYRELQARGLDPSLGWIGNLARQQELRTPPKTQSMNG